MIDSIERGKQRIPPSFCSFLRVALHQRWPRFFRPFSPSLSSSTCLLSPFLYFPPRLISWALPPFCDMKFEQQRVISHEPNEYLRGAASSSSLSFSQWAQSVSHSLTVVDDDDWRWIGGRKRIAKESANFHTAAPRHKGDEERRRMCRDRLRLFAPPPVPLQPPKPPPQVRATW